MEKLWIFQLAMEKFRQGMRDLVHCLTTACSVGEFVTSIHSQGEFMYKLDSLYIGGVIK